MSVQDEIDRLSGCIADAYAAVNERGGELPEKQNSRNLAEAVRSIPSGGMTVEEADGRYLPLSALPICREVTIPCDSRQWPDLDEPLPGPGLGGARVYDYGDKTVFNSVSVPGVRGDSARQLVQILPATAADAEEWAAVGLECYGQRDNSLSFYARRVPRQDIHIFVILQEVQT